MKEFESKIRKDSDLIDTLKKQIDLVAYTEHQNLKLLEAELHHAQLEEAYELSFPLETDLRLLEIEKPQELVSISKNVVCD